MVVVLVGCLAHCWVLGQQDLRSFWGVGLLLPAVLKLMTVVVGGGVVRVVVCQLHSGREHLIWTAAAVHVISFGGLCGVVVVCRECSHLLICTL